MKTCYKNPVVLMAGGLGTRLRPLTKDCPKPMLKIGPKPLLEVTLERLIAQGFYRFYIAVNYLAELVENHFQDGSKWGVEIHYLKEARPLGTAGGLSLFPKAPQEPIIVMNGDLLTDLSFPQLLKFHKREKPSATVCVREYSVQIPYGVVALENGSVSRFEEKPVYTYLTSSGIHVLEPQVLRLVPKNTFFDMPELLDLLIQKRKRIAAFPIHEHWVDIGHAEDFRRVSVVTSDTFQIL